MSAVYVSNLTINSGADFTHAFELASGDTDSPLNLTGYTVYSQMRKHSGSTNYITFSSNVVAPATLGKIQIYLSSAQTSQIKPGRYVYDVIIENSGIKTRVIEGMVLVREGITKL